MGAPARDPDAGGERELIRVVNLSKTYFMGDVRLDALRSVSLTVSHGAFAAIMGPSGSGKSTFMNILGCLDRPTAGEYFLDGEAVAHLDRDKLADVRNRKIGFVFQQFNLLARTSALENVELPMLYSANEVPDSKARALAALESVGLAGREHHTPSQLSGGQQQRVAIARSLVNRPSLILADEPTGALDSRTSIEIMGIFQRLNREQGISILIVTHEPDISLYAQRVIVFKDGRVQKDESIPHPRDAATDLEALGPLEKDRV